MEQDNTVGEEEQSAGIPAAPDGDGNSFDISSFIPNELKDAYEAQVEPVVEEEEAHVLEDVGTTPVLNPDEKMPERTAPRQHANPRLFDVGGEGGQGGEDEEAPQEQNPEKMDLSPEAIQKLIDGDPDAVYIKEEEQEDVDEAFWKSEESYTGMVEGLQQLGYKEEDLDSLLRKVSDKRILDNSKVNAGLSKDLDRAKNQIEAANIELDRLRVIERSAVFDAADTTQEEFTVPMSKAAGAIQETLTTEGLKDVRLTDILMAGDITEVAKVLESYNLEDAARLKINNHWRNYRELKTGYGAARDEAKKDLSKALNTKISPDTVKKLLRNGLKDFIDSGEKVSYLKDALRDGIDNHPQEAKLIASARDNFNNLVSAITNPEVIHNDNWMHNLAIFSLDAAHNKYVEEQHSGVVQELTETKAQLKEVVINYTNLLKSAKGINGKKGSGVVSARGKESSRKANSSDEDILAEYEALLSGNKSIKDIIPT